MKTVMLTPRRQINDHRRAYQQLDQSAPQGHLFRVIAGELA